MKYNKNAQGAIELLIIFSALLLFFIVFFSIIMGNIAEKNLERERLVAQEIALDVQSEVNLASEFSEGYQREFNVPTTVLGSQYNINITDNRVFVFIRNFSMSYKISNITGALNKGNNLIKKENGTVYLN